MAIDLYAADLTQVSSNELLEAVKSFIRIDKPVDQRPSEGYLLDFKQAWGDKALHTVAAFANTFGGLLFLGVSESDARPTDIVGVIEEGELKTRLASLIASNVVPVPDFSIAVCRLQEDVTRCLAVVRVRQCQDVCMITKKGESSPVYVRVEDKSEPTKASQLRALIDKEKRAGGPDAARTAARAEEFNKFFVFRRRSQGNGSEISQSFLRVLLLPTEHPQIEIDLNVEKRFRDTVVRNFPGHEDLVYRQMAIEEWESPRDWSQFALKLNPEAYDYERRWRFYSNGDIGFVTQIIWSLESGPCWSLYDAAADLYYLLKAASGFWQTFGYYGRAQLSVDLRVLESKVQLFRGRQGYGGLFYDQAGAGFSLDPTAIQQRKLQGQDRAEYESPLSYASMESARPYTVSCALNKLLRSFGLGSDLKKLEQSIGSSFGRE